MPAELLAGPQVPVRSAPAPAGGTTGGWESAAYLLSLTLLASLPFKPLQPLAVVAGMPLTVQTVLLAAAAAAWTLWRLSALDSLRWRPIDLLPAAFALSATVSALLTPADPRVCLKGALVIWMGVAFYYLSASVFHDAGQRRRAMAVLAVSAILASLTGIWEVFGGEPARQALSLFKERPTWTGPFLRASGTFHYATALSMFLEATLPFSQFVLGPIGVMISVCAIGLTLTRAGVLSIVLALGWLARTRVFGVKVGIAWGVATFVALVILFPERMLNRLTALSGPVKGDASASVVYEALSAPALARGKSGRLLLRIANTGEAPWPEGTILRREWISLPDRRILTVESFSTHPVDVGRSRDVDIPLTSPTKPGQYMVRYDLVLPDGAQLSDLGAHAPVHRVSVPEAGPWHWEGSELGPVTDPGRLRLWLAAMSMWRDRPFLGVGPEAFRQLSEEYSRGRIRNSLLQAHNLPLQVLSETGLAGLCLFVAAMSGILIPVLRRFRREGDKEGAILLASMIPWLLHGAVDNFLWYLPLNLLFWATLGLLRSYGREG